MFLLLSLTEFNVFDCLSDTLRRRSVDDSEVLDQQPLSLWLTGVVIDKTKRPAVRPGA